MLQRLNRYGHVRGICVDEGRLIDPNSAMTLPVDDIPSTHVREVWLANGFATDHIFLHVTVAWDIDSAAYERHLHQCGAIEA